MTIKSSGTISASEIGFEFGRSVGQSVTIGQFQGVEPGITGAFNSFYGKTSAKSLKLYPSSTNVVQVNFTSDRICAWICGFQDWSNRIYNATSGGATFSGTSLQNTNFPSGLEPTFMPEFYDSVSVDFSGSSGRGPFSILQQPVGFATPFGAAYSGIIQADDSGTPGAGTYTLRLNGTATTFSDKGGFYNPRIYFNRTITGFTDQDTATWYIPILKDPDVSIGSISFQPFYGSNSLRGGTNALQVVSWDSGGVYVRNQFANQYNANNYDVDFRNSGTNLAASALVVYATLVYYDGASQNRNFNHSVQCTHWIHWLLVAGMA